MALKIVMSLTVLLALFQTGYCAGKMCYQCNSQTDPTCADPFKPTDSKLIDCTSTASSDYNRNYLYSILPSEVFGGAVNAPRYCHKVTMATGTIIRACLDVNPGAINHTCDVMLRNAKLSAADKQIKSCSVCESDKCNGAGSLSISLPLMALVAAIAYIFKR